MTRLDARTDRLYADLTATERGIMVLQAWKRNAKEHASVRATIPREQIREFNHLIAVMNAVNSRLGLYVIEIAHAADLLAAETEWLMALNLWSNDVAYLGLMLETYVPMPITASEHQKLVDAERVRFAPVGQLAEAVVEQYEDWAPADLEHDEDGEEVVADVAWERVRGEKERELRGLVTAGKLPGRRTRKGLAIEVGAFYDGLGHPIPVWPEWGIQFDVRPDDEREAVDRGRERIAEVQEVLASNPMLQLRRRMAEKQGCSPLDLPFDPFQQMLVLRAMTAVTRWRELRAVEALFERVGDGEFDGEDPTLPVRRSRRLRRSSKR